MIVFVMVVSFVIECVNRTCQSFLSECVSFSLLFPIIVSGLVIMHFSFYLDDK